MYQAAVILKWGVLILFRFFSGQPMRGRKARRGNSTFLHGATKPRPGKKLGRWDKKPEVHRSLLRQAVLWPVLLLTSVAVYNWTYAAILLAVSFPAWGILAFRKGRLVFFEPFTSSEDGVRSQHWRLRNKWRYLFRKQPVPGLISRTRPAIDPDIDEDVRKAILANMNSSLTGADLPVSRIERPPRRRRINR